MKLASKTSRIGKLCHEPNEVPGNDDEVGNTRCALPGHRLRVESLDQNAGIAVVRPLGGTLYLCFGALHQSDLTQVPDH